MIIKLNCTLISDECIYNVTINRFAYLKCKNVALSLFVQSIRTNPSRYLPDNISVFEIGETGVKTLE